MRAAAVQLTSTPDRDRNLETADRLTRAAAAAGASLVVLPEKWSVLGAPEDIVAGAEPLDGPALSWARATARELGIDLVAGSIAERVEGAERGRNTSVHVGPNGEVQAVYRKIHMFDVEVGGQVYRESANEEPGDEIVLSATADGVELGLTVCYDLRFPELYRILAVRGARILLVPAAFTLATTREHWEVLLRARAIEDQAFVVAPNQVGEHAPGYRSGGRSAIVDPWGVVLAQAPDAETFVTAELDLGRQAEIRRTLPSLANRRPAAYRWPEAVPA
jgi:deaminated glutathione amidase